MNKSRTIETIKNLDRSRWQKLSLDTRRETVERLKYFKVITNEMAAAVIKGKSVKTKLLPDAVQTFSMMDFS